MDIVVANLLQTAKNECVIYRKNLRNQKKGEALRVESGKSLEELIVS